MIQAALPFPWVAVGASAAALLIGLWLFFRRPRKRIGTDPHCHQCDYLLMGINSKRCPECGTIIDAKSLSYGQRRGRLFRRVIGVAVLIIGVGISWTPVQRWAGAVYWYQYRPTFLVMRDLKNGSGLPPPMNNPPPLSWGIWGRVDLACCSLEELQRREKLGVLPQPVRHQIDELELADMARPETTPVQHLLAADFFQRLASRKLTPEEESIFYRRAITVELKAREKVSQGDTLPIRLQYQTAGHRGWEHVAIMRALIDGLIADGSPERIYLWPSGGDFSDERRIVCHGLGKHQLTVQIQIDFGPYGASARPMHSEIRNLTAAFEMVRASPRYAVKLIDDPTLSRAISGSIAVDELDYNLRWPGRVSTTFRVQPSPVAYAFDVFARFNGRDWPIGQISQAAGSLNKQLTTELDLMADPVPVPPAKIDIVLRSSTKVAAATVDLTEIWYGDIVLRDVPIKLIVDKGGNSATP